jgi:hypothetical protein
VRIPAGTIKFVLIVLIALAITRMPYGYYILLKWLSCGIFVYLATQCFRVNSQSWVWVYGVMAGIYNPLIPAHLGRDIWTVVNLATILVVVVSFWRDGLWRRRSNS